MKPAHNRTLFECETCGAWHVNKNEVVACNICAQDMCFECNLPVPAVIDIIAAYESGICPECTAKLDAVFSAIVDGAIKAKHIPDSV